MSYLQTELISHARKVRSLYKQAIRTLQARYQHKDPRKGPYVIDILISVGTCRRHDYYMPWQVNGNDSKARL